MRALVLGLVAVATPAAADSFEAQAQQATRAPLADVIWPVVATCERGDDTQQRQCKQVRDRKRKAPPATYLVVADPGALAIGAWAADKKGVAVSVASCLDCKGVAIEGRRWQVVAAGDKRALYDAPRAFADEVAAKTWRASLGTPRVELVVKAPALAAKKDTVHVDVVAWRVVDPCSGAIVAASPGSQAIAADPKACPPPAGKRPPTAPPAKAP